ncbi:MAG: 4-hydroxy-tetrahydrodipicolinate synthase [Candidatus Cloacimonadota bacterium]|nr:MAG: 4-hydroxy-tetrahydrodipicolinate synthase [Candidatus Cloacimonadota bacterium]
MSMFTGSIVALATPFKNGGINYETLKKLFEFHKKNGTDAILLSGTTGESPTLSLDEKIGLFSFGKKNTEIPIIAGTGNYNTKETIELTKKAEEIGVDAALVITPYYNKPTQNGLYAHFKKIAENTRLPIIVYNVPGRTGVSISPEIVAELSRIPNIVGIKEASGSLKQCFEIKKKTEKDFILLSGDDALTIPIMSIGGKGVISVSANIVPEMVREMVQVYLSGDLDKAMELHYKLLPLTDAMFVETNPIPVKTALGLIGFDMGPLRLPLVEPGEKSLETIMNELKKIGAM